MSSNGPQGGNGPQNGWFFGDAGHSTDDEAHGLFTVYGSYGSFLSGEGVSIDLVPLGNGGMSDDDVRSANMATIFNAMGNYVSFFWEDTNQYSNVFPISNIQANFERVANNSAKASLYSLEDSRFYDFSKSPSSTGIGQWKERVQYGQDGNIEVDDGVSITNGSVSVELSGNSVVTSNSSGQMTFNGSTLDLNNQASIVNLKLSDNSTAAATVGQLSQQTSGGIQDAFQNTLNPTSSNAFGLQNIAVQSNSGYNYPNNQVFCITSFNYSEYTSINSTLDNFGPNNPQNGWFGMYIIPSDLGTGECILAIHESIIGDYATLAGFQESNIMSLNIDGIHAIIPDDVTVVYDYPSNCYINYQGAGVSTSSTANNYTDPMYVDSNGNPTYQGWDGENTQRCSGTVYSIESAFDVKLQKSGIYVKKTSDSGFSVYDPDSNWYAVKIMFKNRSFSYSYIRPFFTTIGAPDQPYTGPSVEDSDLGSIEFSSANTSVTGKQISRNTDGLKQINGQAYGIQSAIENNLGSLGSLTSRNDFRIGMSYNSGTGRGSIIHGFDTIGRIHSNNSISVSDNPNSSGRMNISFNSGTGLGLIDKEVVLEDGADSLKEIKFNSVSLGKPSEVSVSILDDMTTSIDLGKSNDTLQLDLNIHIKTTSEDSWIRGRLIKRGGQYFVHAGRIEGKEFTQISFEYDENSSNIYGNHFINVVGAGTGASMDVFIRSEDPFNK